MTSVLIVEDQKMAQENMEAIIKTSENYTLAGIIPNAADAELFCMRGGVDLILMDIDMPDMDGVSAVNEIHKQGLAGPVIFLTGRCDKETVRDCGRCGAADYILKPANPVYLRTRVEMALNNIVTNVLI